jgi:hypothetical protein
LGPPGLGQSDLERERRGLTPFWGVGSLVGGEGAGVGRVQQAEKVDRLRFEGRQQELLLDRAKIFFALGAIGVVIKAVISAFRAKHLVNSASPWPKIQAPRGQGQKNHSNQKPGAMTSLAQAEVSFWPYIIKVKRFSQAGGKMG